MKQILISDELFVRLQSHAAPLVDTVEDVIRRALDSLADESEVSTEDIVLGKEFNPRSPPNIGYTKIVTATVNGHILPKNESYWVLVLAKVISVAAEVGGLVANDVNKFYSGTALGLIDRPGQYQVKDVGVTLHGRSADVCLKAICSLVDVYGIEVDIHFQWYVTDKAAFPGGAGKFAIRRH